MVKSSAAILNTHDCQDGLTRYSDSYIAARRQGQQEFRISANLSTSEQCKNINRNETQNDGLLDLSRRPFSFKPGFVEIWKDDKLTSMKIVG